MLSYPLVTVSCVFYMKRSYSQRKVGCILWMFVLFFHWQFTNGIQWKRIEHDAKLPCEKINASTFYIQMSFSIALYTVFFLYVHFLQCFSLSPYCTYLSFFILVKQIFVYKLCLVKEFCDFLLCEIILQKNPIRIILSLTN